MARATTAWRPRSAAPRASTAADIVRGQEQQAATGRFTTPAEVADLVVLLASDRTANVTGADFVIDGGLTTTT